MKKLLYLAMIAVAGAFVASCQPELIDGPDYGQNGDLATLQNGFRIIGQYADQDCTIPQADGNFIKYTTSPATTVQVYNYKNDSKNLLAVGASGVFNITPKRGQDPNQKFMVAAINPDASIYEFESSVNVFVPAELAPEMKLLLGDGGVKVWTWASADSPVWGNAGNSGAGAAFTAGVVDGQWWGASPVELLDQLSHAAGGVATGTEDPAASMQFDEDGNAVVFDAAGNVVYATSYQVKDYNPARNAGWELGKLITEGPGILFPFSINENGKIASELDIMYLDPNYMTLVYTKGNGAGSWGEITWWKFKNLSGAFDALNGGSERKWGWAYADAPVWGNAGNTGVGSAFTAGVVDGQWWGATPAELADQLAHSGDKPATGEESFDAYMTFNVDGTVNTYAPDGTKIRGGSYTVTMNPDGRATSGWELGKLTTDQAAILFPYSINEGGKEVTEFDIMYTDADQMTLVYTKGNGPGSWGEITFWKLAAK